MHPAVSLRSNCVALSSQSPLFQEWSISPWIVTDKQLFSPMQDVDRNSQDHQHKAVEELQVALVTTHAPALQKVQWNLLQMDPGKTKEVDVQVIASCKQVPFPFVPLFGCLAHGSIPSFHGLHLLLKLLSYL